MRFWPDQAISDQSVSGSGFTQSRSYKQFESVFYSAPIPETHGVIMISQAALQTSNRLIAAILGGYAFTWGFCAFGITALVALGVDFHEAETGISMVAFLVYLSLFLWTFATASMTRIWLILAGGAAVMQLAAITLQSNIIS